MISKCKKPFNADFFQMSVSVCVTCQDIIGVKLHVHSVFLRYVSHDPLGAAVLLSGQQPTQWLREDPVKKTGDVLVNNTWKMSQNQNEFLLF